MVVVSHVLCLVGIFLPQGRQVGTQFVATALPKGLREGFGPGRHRSEFSLEGPDDHAAEKGPHMCLVRPMYYRQERLAGRDIEVVKATLDAIEQHESMGTGPLPCDALTMYRDRDRRAFGLALSIDRENARGQWRASLRALQQTRA